MGSLIINTNKERKKVEEEIAFGAQYRSVPKIVADGGFKRIDQIVKALALGADYVMLGEVLAKSFEACGRSYYVDADDRIYDESEYYPDTHREYYGMSTEKAQHLINDASLFRIDNFKPKHSEGQIKTVPIIYHIKDWVADFEHALRSSMSYAGTRTLKDYIGEVEYHYMTPITYNAYMK
jgi:IMP dehydrogenase